MERFLFSYRLTNPCFLVFVVTLCSGLTLTPIQRELLAQSWSQYQGNSRHTGYVPALGTPLSNQPTWVVDTNSVASSTSVASLVRGIASDGENIFLSWNGTNRETNGISAVAVGTGLQSWEWAFTGKESEKISAPSYGGGNVYAHRGGHSLSQSDTPTLFGISAISGSRRFAASLDGQHLPGNRPAVIGNEVFVAGGTFGGLSIQL